MNEHNKANNRWVDERKEDGADFIDRMYDIMNVQSRAQNKIDQQTGREILIDGIPQENDIKAQEGVSLADFKKTMMPWIRKWTELKDRDNL